MLHFTKVALVREVPTAEVRNEKKQNLPARNADMQQMSDQPSTSVLNKGVRSALFAAGGLV